MPTSITSASAVLMLQVAVVYPSPVQIQAFAADDVYDIDALEAVETMMGVDGHLSGGFVYVPIKQNIALMGDSISNDVFDNWYLGQQAVKDTFIANGTITLPALGKKYAMNRGFLSTYKPIADGKKVLQPRKFAITWESITVANT